MNPYRTIVQSLLQQFQKVRCERSSRSTNRHADALITLASKIQMQEEDQNTI